VTKIGNPPGIAELELTLLGPGYGENIVLHVGNCGWVVDMERISISTRNAWVTGAESVRDRRS